MPGITFASLFVGERVEPGEPGSKWTRLARILSILGTNWTADKSLRCLPAPFSPAYCIVTRIVRILAARTYDE